MDASTAAIPVAATAAGIATHESIFGLLFPFFVLLGLALSIPVALLGLNMLLSGWAVGFKNSNPGKITPVESGIANSIGTAGEKFSIKFYLVAMLFLAFDIEVAFLYPWALHFNKAGWFMVADLAVFLVVLWVGYLYLYRKGALDWDK